MARPTKEQKAKREAIKDLGLFVRDSEIYTYFEDETEKAKRTPSELSYLFCEECTKRTTKYRGSLKELNEYKTDKYKLQSLFLLDYKLAEYLFFLCHFKYIDYSNDKAFFPPYYSDTLAYKKDIDNALGRDLNKDLIKNMVDNMKDFQSLSTKEEKEELENWKEHYYTDDELISLSFMRDSFLTKEDRIKIKNYYKNLDYENYHNLNYLTIITKNYPQHQEDGLNRNVFAELDLTKPIEELMEFVTMLKKDYDKDPTNISNFHRLIGMELEDHKCSTEICDIFKHKNPKPLSGKLMDVLFIYDCGIAGLDDDYISKQITNYWSENRNINPPKEIMSKNTIQTYRKLAKDYIDRKEYKNFIKGYVIPLD